MELATRLIYKVPSYRVAGHGSKTLKFSLNYLFALFLKISSIQMLSSTDHCIDWWLPVNIKTKNKTKQSKTPWTQCLLAEVCLKNQTLPQLVHKSCTFEFTTKAKNPVSQDVISLTIVCHLLIQIWGYWDILYLCMVGCKSTCRKCIRRSEDNIG